MQTEVAELLAAAANAPGAVATAVASDEVDLVEMAQVRSAGLWVMAKALGVEVEVGAEAGPGKSGMVADSAVLMVAAVELVGEVAAAAEVADGRAARNDSPAVAVVAFGDSGAQRDGCRPNWRQERAEEVQVLQVAGFESEHPIVAPEDRIQERRADTPVGARPEAVERCLGLANQSLAVL